MALSLESIALQYAIETGCDEATAMQAAFVAATLLADMAGRKDIGDYFSKRATEMEAEKTGEPAVRVTSYAHVTASIERGRTYPAHEAVADIYRPGGVWHWE